MANNMQSAIDLARLSLNDNSKTSWADVELLTYANDAIQRLVSVRPDLFIGMFSALPSDSITLTDTFPLPIRYKRAVADYVIARANLKGTEESAENKAMAYVQMFGAEI